MPTDHSNLRCYPNDPPVRGLALVISCVDFRLLDDLVCFLDHENLTNRYYHLALAGVGLAFGDPQQAPTKPNPKSRHYDPTDINRKAWLQLLEDHVKLTLKLTAGKLSDILIIEHRDCGAYTKELGLFFKDDVAGQAKEANLHGFFARALKATLKRIAKDQTDIKLKSYAKKIKSIRLLLMDLHGNVSRLG